jgi:hypothetical protein
VDLTDDERRVLLAMRSIVEVGQPCELRVVWDGRISHLRLVRTRSLYDRWSGWAAGVKTAEAQHVKE